MAQRYGLRRGLSRVAQSQLAALATILVLLASMPADATAATREPMPSSEAVSVGRGVGPSAVDTTPSRSEWSAARAGRGTVYQVTFWAPAGVKILVEGLLPLRVPASAADGHLAGIAVARCRGDGGDRRTMTIARNIRRGQTVRLRPGFLYTPTITGDHRCEVALRTGRPRPARYGGASNTVRLAPGGQLRVSRADDAVSESFRPGRPSPLVRRGRPLPTFAAVRIPSTMPRFQIAFATYLTSCTSRSGSYDTISGRYTCPQRLVRRSDSRVRVRVLLAQLGGGTCGRRVALVDQVVRVDKHLHHLPFWRGVSGELRPDCGDAVARLSFTTLSATPVVVHRSGTLLRVRVRP